ncbi:thioredoxin family protein [Algirhabdus cladophorae]|uniref:thioredoxin family protein n=1 Tax=Algirhabdus cladophorae TaxID=3377108 RepID=UPI003B846F39
MNRRDFMLLTGATVTLPSVTWAKAMAYTPGLVKEKLAAGETVLIDYTATWCSTCRAQGRTLTKLKEANSAYEENITFIDIDWDQFGRGDLAQELKIPRRSTLVLLRGDQELGRIVADTRESNIKALLDRAL